MKEPDVNLFFSSSDVTPWTRIKIDKKGMSFFPKVFRDKVGIRSNQVFEVVYKKGYLILLPLPLAKNLGAK